MKKMLIVMLLALAAGCAALNGQVPYNGPAGVTPTMGFETRRSIRPCGPFAQNDCMVKDTIGWVTNPNVYPVRMTIDCDDLFTLYENIVVPPKTTQYFLIDKSTKRCWLRERVTLVPPG